MATVNLYRAVSDFSGKDDFYKRTLVHWYKNGLQPQRFNSEYIRDYDPGCPSEHDISELFTFEEVQCLKKYLNDLGEDCEIEQIKLPLPKAITFNGFPDELKDIVPYTIQCEGEEPLRICGDYYKW